MDVVQARFPWIREVGKGAIGLPSYAPGPHSFEDADQCNPIPIIQAHTSAAVIGFTVHQS